MYTTITIFYVSLLGIIVMLVLKAREDRTGRPNIVTRVGGGVGVEGVFQTFFSAISRAVSYVNRHTFIALAHLIAFHILKHIRNVYVDLKHRFISTSYGRKLIDAVRGRGEVSDHGASFYLRRISK